MKFSGYYFYMNLNVWGDFQICICVPLSYCHFDSLGLKNPRQAHLIPESVLLGDGRCTMIIFISLIVFIALQFYKFYNCRHYLPILCENGLKQKFLQLTLTAGLASYQGKQRIMGSQKKNRGGHWGHAYGISRSVSEEIASGFSRG